MLQGDPAQFQRFFREARQPIWSSKVSEEGEAEKDFVRYGTFDVSQFTELELRMYTLIKARIASMWELKTCYTLDEALKVYAMFEMENDVEKGRMQDSERRMK